MRNKIYQEYCQKVIQLCEFARKNHCNLLKLDNENIIHETNIIKNSIEEFLSDTKSIFFLGHSSSGKSTFMNHVLGKKIIPQTTKIETRVVSKIYHSDKNQIVLFLKNIHDITNLDSQVYELITEKTVTNPIRIILKIPDEWETYSKLVKSNNSTQSKNDAKEYIDEVHINLNTKFNYFNNFTFYDTPGIDSAKADTDEDVISKLLTKFSSYVFFMFDASEYAQKEIVKQINDNKTILKQIEQKRLVFIGTHLDQLEKQIKEGNRSETGKLSELNYTNNLKSFLESLGIEYLDVFLLNLSPKTSKIKSFPDLELKDKVTMGKIEHAINMHSYKLDNYFENLILKKPEYFIQNYIEEPLKNKREEAKTNIIKIKKDIDEEKKKKIKRNFEIRESAQKQYFEDYLLELDKKINKLLTEDKHHFDDNLEKISKHINNFKNLIKKAIENDHGGLNCSYSKLKVNLISKVENFDNFDLNNFKSSWIVKTFFSSFTNLSTKREPFSKRHNSVVFSEFMSHFNKTKKKCYDLIDNHYGKLTNENNLLFKDKNEQLENDIHSYTSLSKSLKKTLTQIKEMEDDCLQTLSNIKVRLNANKKIVHSNTFLKFLNIYREFKNNQ